jgi:hypothetical protein
MGERDFKTTWWKAEEGQVHRAVFARVETIESEQARIFNRFIKLAKLYDRHETLGQGSDAALLDSGRGGLTADTLVSENVVKSNVDTFVAFTGSSRPGIRCMTDGAEWSIQRRAKKMERWIEGIFEQAGAYRHGPHTAKAAGVLGHAALKEYPEVDADGDYTGKMALERTIIDEIVVDEVACKSTPPREMFHRRAVDREALIDQYPDFEEEIRKAPSGTLWAGYRPYEKNQVMVIEGWQLGKRHVLCVDGADLIDEKWPHQWFPFVFLRFSERLTGFYGCGIAEDLAGHQRQLNRINRQTDRNLEMLANPFWLVQQGDAQLGGKIVQTEAGRVVVYKSTKPEQSRPMAVSPEVYQRRNDLIDSSYKFVGNSILSAQSKKPADVESGAALNALADSETQRFAVQAQMYEQVFIDLAQLSMNWAKIMGKAAPNVVVKATGRRAKELKWSEVNLDDLPFEMSLQATSGLSRTPAGRLDAAMRLAQSGLIGPDETRRLLDHPDIQRAMTIANAAFEDIEAAIENMLDGELEVPEPYQFLDLGVVLVQKAYLDARRTPNTPEDVLEALRTWIMQANHLRGVGDEPANQNAVPGAPPMPMGAGAGGPPGMLPPPPQNVTPMPGIAAAPMRAM